MIPALLQRLRRLTLPRQFLLVFVTAFTIRAGLVLATHQYKDLSRYELQRTAYSLATTGVFGNPYAIPTGPTAHVAPGYPVILAAIYRLFGAETTGEFVKEMVASAVCAIQWALVPVAASTLAFSSLTGLFAGMLGALLPFKLSVETKGDWEAIYSALAVMLIACITIGIWRRRQFTAADGIRSGLSWGIALLFYPAMLPILGCFLIVGAIMARREPAHHGKFALVQILLAGAILMPWIVRNKIQLGSPIATRTNFGLEVRLSNNNLAGPLERENYEHGVYHIYHPLQSVQEAEKVRDLGEVAYNKSAMDEAVGWITAHPASFIKLTAERIYYFWFQPVPGQRMKAAWLGATSLLCFAGLYFLWRKEPLVAMMMTLMLLILPLPNYLVHVGLRHRYPMDWICNLLTVFAFRAIWRRG
jgi:hypothetical protein